MESAEASGNLKWKSDQYDDWCFKKNKFSLASWVEYKNHNQQKYTQISFEKDRNGLSSYTLKQMVENEEYWVLLTPNISFWGSNQTHIDKVLTSGYWVQQEG